MNQSISLVGILACSFLACKPVAQTANTNQAFTNSAGSVNETCRTERCSEELEILTCNQGSSQTGSIISKLYAQQIGNVWKLTEEIGGRRNVAPLTAAQTSISGGAIATGECFRIQFSNFSRPELTAAYASDGRRYQEKPGGVIEMSQTMQSAATSTGGRCNIPRVADNDGHFGLVWGINNQTCAFNIQNLQKLFPETRSLSPY